MKKISVILVLAVIVVAALFLLKKNAPSPPLALPTKETNRISSKLPETNLVEIVSNTFSTTLSQSTNTAEVTEPINALTATNLEQWKTAIKGLKPLGGFTADQHWLVEQPGRKTSLSIELSLENRTVKYDAVLISVNAENGTGKVTRIEMQTLNMNIEGTRDLGLQLCDMLEVDPKDFLSWCNKVGNHWLDAPLYATGKGAYGFQILNTFDNQKPWCINFVIVNQ
jgi:hypothetical protein